MYTNTYTNTIMYTNTNTNLPPTLPALCLWHSASTPTTEILKPDKEIQKDENTGGEEEGGGIRDSRKLTNRI